MPNTLILWRALSEVLWVKFWNTVWIPYLAGTSGSVLMWMGGPSKAKGKTPGQSPSIHWRRCGVIDPISLQHRITAAFYLILIGPSLYLLMVVSSSGRGATGRLDLAPGMSTKPYKMKYRTHNQSLSLFRLNTKCVILHALSKLNRICSMCSIQVLAGRCHCCATIQEGAVLGRDYYTPV